MPRIKNRSLQLSGICAVARNWSWAILILISLELRGTVHGAQQTVELVDLSYLVQYIGTIRIVGRIKPFTYMEMDDRQRE